MEDLKMFFESLGDAQQDHFMSAVNFMQSSAHPDRIEKLECFLETLKKEINRINDRRSYLSSQVQNLQKILEKLDMFLRTKQSTELVLLRNSLDRLIDTLRGEVDSLKPEGKLLKKFDVAQKLKSLKQRSELSLMICEAVMDEEAFAKKMNRGEVPVTDTVEDEF